LIQSEGDSRAKAILAGAAQAHATDTQTDDPDLRDDETELGRILARAHHSVAFRLGCAQVLTATAK